MVWKGGCMTDELIYRPNKRLSQITLYSSSQAVFIRDPKNVEMVHASTSTAVDHRI